MSVWKIKYMVYFHYLSVRGEIGKEMKEPSTSEVAPHWSWIGYFLIFFILNWLWGAVFAPLNPNVAPVFSKLALTIGSI